MGESTNANPINMTMMTRLTKTALMFALALPAVADTLYVNNDLSIPADYRTFDAAFAAASDGDTIMLAGSQVSYGDIVIVGKSINLVGNGASMNDFPALQPQRANWLTTKVRTLYIGLNEGGSSGGLDVSGAAAANGTRVTGLEALSFYLWSNQCSLRDMKISSSSYTWGSNNVFERSVLLGEVGLRDSATTAPPIAATGNLFRNCLFSNSGVRLYSNTSITLEHCVLEFVDEDTTSTSTSITRFSSGSAILRHCIIGNPTLSNAPNGPVYDSYDNARLFNCLIVGLGPNPIPAHSIGNNNITTSNLTSVFDSGFKLAAGSPALGAGADGEDLGIFGGPTPFEWGGVPAVPLIKQFDILSADPTTGLTFRLKAEARD